MTMNEILAARLEAVAHATAVLLASRLTELSPRDAARACDLFTGALGATDDLPFQTYVDRRERRAIMTGTLEAIADRALEMAQPVR
jgi:class 3 adenylate cyclase